MPAPTPNTGLDLTTVSKVLNWLNTASAASITDPEKQNVQDCITAWSTEWLNLTGFGPSDGSVPTNSPFVAPVTYDEYYDGSGSNRQFLRNRPIISVSLLQIGLMVVPLSSGPGQYGYVIDGSAKSIALRGGYGRAPSGLLTVGFQTRLGCGLVFTEDIQNVRVTYSAGFAATPFDIEFACRRMVAATYKKRQWIEQKSQSMANGAGTTTYQSWDIPPEIRNVIDNYRRVAFI